MFKRKIRGISDLKSVTKEAVFNQHCCNWNAQWLNVLLFVSRTKVSVKLVTKRD